MFDSAIAGDSFQLIDKTKFEPETEKKDKMAPIFSKFIKLKSGYKIPINESNVKAVVKITKIEQKARKIPVKYVPRPGQDRDLSSEPDRELNQLLEEAEIRRSAREMSESGQNPAEVRQNRSEINQNRPDYDQNRPDYDQNRPDHDQNRPDNGQIPVDNGQNPVDNGQNPVDNGQNNDFDELLEPNLALSDITLAQRAEILLFAGTDKCKRRQFYLQYYPNFYHYYESLDCWDECPIKSKIFTFLVNLKSKIFQ